MMNRDKPADSPLLQAPIRPHGTMKAPVFTDREQSQYRQLVEWVYLVSNNKQAAPRPTLEERGAPLLQTISGQSPANVPPTSSPAASTSPAAGGAEPPSPAPPPNPTEQPAAAAPLPLEQEAFRITRTHGQLVLRPLPKRGESAEYIPKDPFDPEIFNRRFFGPNH